MTFDFTTIDWRVILAAVAIIVTIVIAVYSVWWRNRKRLSYEILSDVELVSSEKIRGKVEILYEGQPVESVYLVVVKLINDGYQPVKKDEFEKPVRFKFKRIPDKEERSNVIFQQVKVLSAEKEEFQPENIATEITYQDNWVELTAALFNRKDYVQFKVLLDGFSKMEIDARIVGVSKVGKIRKLPPSVMQITFIIAGFLVSVLVNLASETLMQYQINIVDRRVLWFIGLAVVVVGIYLFVRFRSN